MQEMVTLNRKEQKRLMVSNEVGVGENDGHGGITVIVPFPAPREETTCDASKVGRCDIGTWGP